MPNLLGLGPENYSNQKSIISGSKDKIILFLPRGLLVRLGHSPLLRLGRGAGGDLLLRVTTFVRGGRAILGREQRIGEERIGG